MAASMGKGKGGNAIIIRQGSEFGVGKITGMKNDPSVFAYNQTTALVIRWLSAKGIEDEAERNRGFLVVAILADQMHKSKAAEESGFQISEFATIRWGGRDNTQLIRPNGRVEKLRHD